jgi:hypothetical protein
VISDIVAAQRIGQQVALEACLGTVPAAGTLCSAADGVDAALHGLQCAYTCYDVPGVA